MKLLQAFFLCVFLSFGIQKTTAQVIRYKADSFSVSEKNSKGKWSDWTKPETSTVVITLDGKKDRIVVGSKEIQVYTIVKYGEKTISKYDETIPLECADLDGRPCTIFFITRKNQNNRRQFYISLKNMRIVYNVAEIL